MFVKCHGSYIRDLGCFKPLMTIPVMAALAFWLECRNESEDVLSEGEFENMFINKNYRVFKQTYNKVYAIYKHDYNWWLYEADKKEFLKHDHKRLKELPIPRG